MDIVSCILLCLILLIVGYFGIHQTYWWRNGIKGPRGLPFIGSFYEVADVNHPRGFVLHEWTKKFREVYGYYEGTIPVLVVSNLGMLQELLSKKFDNFYARKLTNMIHGDMESTAEEPLVNLFVSRGSRWKRLRALATEGFTSKSLRQMHDTMEDSAINMVDLMLKHEDGAAFNIHEYFQEFTYDVISRLAMGQPNSELFKNSGIAMTKSVLLRTHRVFPWYLAVMFPKWQYWIKKVFYNHENIRGGDVGKLFMYCAKAVTTRMKERAENSKLGIENAEQDFIDMLLKKLTEKIEDTEYGTSIEKKATVEDVVGSCFVFLLAGFDTTANSLGYAAYLLAQHPEKMRKAQQEIDNVVGTGNVSYDTMPKLTYLEAIVKETLRLCPVGWFACSRECVTPTTLGNVKLDKGVRIEADVMSIQRSKKIWGDDAEKFVPER
ncbi:hypothetical protein GCK72_025472 [Caenorhabditis remanei]|uniref:Uncharacterized protein n=1 Tax=Caenorhabditis remanei TaxID=31234 RepID=A0A6A5G2S6_CAERE|nr:hypothetical protein GCK72_025472 [Caenorhabditis remanei]KAF1749005.1 hypothetical protein GCK72_025472 [Caenorhabditis remanei]